MGFSLRFAARLALLVALAPALRAGPATAQTTPACVPASPVLSGPAGVQAGETYAVSWTNVLGDRATASNASDAYVVVRALDAAFTKVTDSTTTQRSALTLAAPPASATALYHRILVRTSCPTASPAAILSNVLAIPVKTICDAPPSVGELTSSPANPPAFSTWVVSWNTLGTGAGPGGGFPNLKFRLRRTSPLEPEGRERVVDAAPRSFAGPPGDYVFEVRAEAACGAVGPWSPPTRVTVGTVVKPTLVLMSEPTPLAQLVPAPGVRAATSFAVRNGGTALSRRSRSARTPGFVISPAQFTLAQGAVQEISVTSLYGSALARPVRPP